MNVAPAPGLAAFEGCNYRMSRRVEVLQSMRMLRILAAPDVAAGETHAKLVPLRPQREAFLAAARARRDLPNFTYMFTAFGYRWHTDVSIRATSGGRLRVFSAASWKMLKRLIQRLPGKLMLNPYFTRRSERFRGIES